MHVHFPFPKHSAVAPREWTMDQRGFFLKDRQIAYRSCTPVCPVSFHVIPAETVTRSSWPRLVPMVAPIAEIKSGPEIPKCTTSTTNHWHQCAGRLEEYQSCGSWGWSMQVKLSRNIFWPFQVSWAYLLPTDCFSDFRGESMSWIRYTPNIALSNRLLQHGRPWLWVSKPIICSCAPQDSITNAIHRKWTALDEAIQQGPDCLIATPGRLNDFVQKKQVCGAHSEQPEEWKNTWLHGFYRGFLKHIYIYIYYT